VNPPYPSSPALGFFWCYFSFFSNTTTDSDILPSHRPGLCRWGGLTSCDLGGERESALVEDDGDLGMGRTCCNAAEQIGGAACSHTHTHTHTHTQTAAHRHTSHSQTHPLYINTIKQHSYTQINKNTHTHTLFSWISSLGGVS